MLISHTTELALQDAAKTELQTSQFYRHLATQCKAIGFFGAAKYYRAESKDEIKHYNLIADYLNDSGSVAETPDIMGMPEKITALKQTLDMSYNLMVEIGKKYEQWYSIVDPTTARFFLQFLDIQRKAVGYYADQIQRYNIVANDPAGILLLDQELGNS